MNTTSKRVAAGGAAVGAIAVIVAAAWGFGSAVTAEPTPTKTVQVIGEFSEPYVEPDAGLLEDAVARVQVERAAAEAARIEAERVAAEAAAAEAARIEAERVAAEQAATRQQEQQRAGSNSNSTSTDNPWANKMRVPWVSDLNPENTMGGYWDTSQCPTQSGSTGPDGIQYCD